MNEPMTINIHHFGFDKRAGPRGLPFFTISIRCRMMTIEESRWIGQPAGPFFCYYNLSAVCESFVGDRRFWNILAPTRRIYQEIGLKTYAICTDYLMWGCDSRFSIYRQYDLKKAFRVNFKSFEKTWEWYWNFHISEYWLSKLSVIRIWNAGYEISRRSRNCWQGIWRDLKFVFAVTNFVLTDTTKYSY